MAYHYEDEPRHWTPHTPQETAALLRMIFGFLSTVLAPALTADEPRPRLPLDAHYLATILSEMDNLIGRLEEQVGERQRQER